MYQALASELQRFPRIGIARTNTPLEPMQPLTAFLGGPRLWVKRDDLTGAGIAGNKLRKLDHVLHAATDCNADTLVAAGVVQSNTLTQVAAAASTLGLDCHLAVFHGSVPAPPPASELAGNARLNRVLGAHIHNIYWDGDRKRACDALCATLRSRGKRPYAVPYGVSNPLGAVAYASASVEIAQQSEALGITPAAIVHGAGSGATQAGLIAGAATAMPDTKIIGMAFEADLQRIRRDTIKQLHGVSALLNCEAMTESVEIAAWRSNPHYGLPHKETTDAIELAATQEALLLDTIYSGRALAGLIAMVRSGRWRQDCDVVFIHTGGVHSSHINSVDDFNSAA